MPIRITLDNKEIIEVDIALDDWNRAFQRALASNTMVEIQEPDGHIVSINPRQVNVVEATSPEQGAPRQAQIA
jgi:hypothetical protein